MNSASAKSYYSASEGEDRMVIVMQDLSVSGEFGHQFKGATPTQVETGINYLVNLHSEWLHEEKKQILENHLPHVPHLLYKSLVGPVKGWIERSFELIDNRTMPVQYKGTTFEKLGRNILQDPSFLWKVTSNMEGRLQTLLHSDFRLDNLWFSEDHSQIIPCDWQGMFCSAILVPPNSFLCQAIRQDNPLADVLIWILEVCDDVPNQFPIMLKSYHNKLLEQGVTDYSYDDCLWDARMWSFACIFVRCLHVCACITFWDNSKVLKSCIFMMERSIQVIDQTDISFFEKLESKGSEPF